MNALGQVAIRVSESSAIPVAVVIGPPWLRTGTGRVIQDQIAYYRDRGFSTAFVGVPVRPEHGPENPMWAEQVDAACELRADHASFAILDAPQNPKTLRHRILAVPGSPNIARLDRRDGSVVVGLRRLSSTICVTAASRFSMLITSLPWGSRADCGENSGISDAVCRCWWKRTTSSRRFCASGTNAIPGPGIRTISTCSSELKKPCLGRPTFWFIARSRITVFSPSNFRKSRNCWLAR